jgi:hypothetical protein
MNLRSLKFMACVAAVSLLLTGAVGFKTRL